MRRPLNILAVEVLTLPILFLVVNFSPISPGSSYPSSHPIKGFFTRALAEDDEDEHEDESDDEGRSSGSSSSSSQSSSKTKTIQVIKEVVVYKPVTTTIVVTPDDYAKDTDGDTLVDAIDPDPLVPQSQYFSDDDNDSVPNAIDRYPGEDDFAYYEFETDNNGNGILDSYEQ